MRTPILDALVAKGKIWIKKNDYFGSAEDNVIVWLGEVGREKNLEQYLQEHPTPIEW